MKARNGGRQIVFVTGEPGIGKTALIEAFLAGVRSREFGAGSPPPSPLNPSSQIAVPGVWWGWGQCIEQHGAGEAFLPILDALGRLCRGPEGTQVVELLRRHAPMWLVQMPAFIESEELELLQRKVQGASRERMLREMAEALEELTAETPLVLVLEDLHWSDVSTLDLLAFIAHRDEPARLLVIGTYRPMEMLSDGHALKGITQELYGHQQATELSLGGLSEEAIAHYLAVRSQIPSPSTGEGQGEGEMTGAMRKLAHTLHQRTDGNPLFLVALVNDLIERSVLMPTDTGCELKEDAVVIGSTIPDTIRHLVARQSERLSREEQHTLEAASVAGMEFSAAAVSAALVTDIVRVERECEQLVQRQQFLRRLGVEEWPDGTLAARYGFLHALYQQLWHERVTPTQLQQCHLRIGERKERAYGERVREIAVELAVHFEQGRDYWRAVQYLQQAGENAVRRSANQEAIGLLAKGVNLLQPLLNTPARAQLEVTLQIPLGGSLIATKGFAASEVENAYSRARELCQQIGETPQLFPALRGLWQFCLLRGELHTARKLAEQLLGLAESVQKPDLLLIAHDAMGEVLFWSGEFAHARGYLEQGLTFYNSQRHRSQIFLYAYDYGMVCLYYIYGPSTMVSGLSRPSTQEK